MKKLMVAIALVSFTAFSFAAGPASNIKPAPKQESTVNAHCTATSQTSKKDVKKADKKAATATKEVSVKK